MNNIKRLVKSEFFCAQGKEENNNYIEIFKNPTSKEIEEVKKKINLILFVEL